MSFFRHETIVDYAKLIVKIAKKIKGLLASEDYEKVKAWFSKLKKLDKKEFELNREETSSEKIQMLCTEIYNLSSEAIRRVESGEYKDSEEIIDRIILLEEEIKKTYERLLREVVPMKRVNLSWAEFTIDPEAKRRLYAIKSDEAFIEKVGALLWKYRATEFNYLTGGWEASVFSISKRFVLKIYLGDLSRHIIPQFVLQPQEIIYYQRLSLVIVPRIETGRITRQLRERVIREAREQGYKITDGVEDDDNYGILQNGTPKWLDFGGYEPIN